MLEDVIIGSIRGGLVRRILLNALVGTATIWTANELVEGVVFKGTVQELIIVGLILGLLNFFIKPILRLITLPLRFITLGFFGIVLDMFLIWITDVSADIFVPGALDIIGIRPLFWATIIMWIVGIAIRLLAPILLPGKQKPQANYNN